MRIHQASLIRAAEGLEESAELFGRNTEKLLAATTGGARSPWGIGVIGMVMDQVNDLLGDACGHLRANLDASGAGFLAMAERHAVAERAALATIPGAVMPPSTAVPTGSTMTGAVRGMADVVHPATSGGEERGLMLPPALETAFALLGVPWPTADEVRLRECAAVYEACGRTLTAEVIPLAQYAVTHATVNNAGDGIDAATAFWNGYHHQGADSEHLSSLATALHTLAGLHGMAATVVEAVKWTFLTLAGIVAAALAWAAVAAAFTAGGATLHARTVIAGLRLIAQRVTTVFRGGFERFLGQALGRGVETRLRRILGARRPAVAKPERTTVTPVQAAPPVQTAPPVPPGKTPRPVVRKASPYDFEPTDPPVDSSRRSIGALRESMIKDGYKGPPVAVVVHERRMFVVDGNHRLRASEGVLDEIPYREVELPFLGFRNMEDVLEEWEASKRLLPEWMAERAARRTGRD